jgi:phage terminase small subunit
MSEEANIPLTDKQELFCHEYLIDLNQTQAYIRAFDCESYNTARSESSRLAANPNISARIKELMAERVEKLNVDQNWVLLSLLDIRQKASVSQPVIKWNPQTKQMEETGEYIFDSNGANKATELIGKHMGMFKDKVEHSGEVGITPIIIQGQKFADKDGE